MFCVLHIAQASRTTETSGLDWVGFHSWGRLEDSSRTGLCCQFIPETSVSHLDLISEACWFSFSYFSLIWTVILFPVLSNLFSHHVVWLMDYSPPFLLIYVDCVSRHWNELAQAVFISWSTELGSLIGPCSPLINPLIDDCHQEGWRGQSGIVVCFPFRTLCFVLLLFFKLLFSFTCWLPFFT